MYKVMEDDYMGYAVFKRCEGFWQQVSKWYVHRKCAENFMFKRTDREDRQRRFEARAKGM